MVARDHGARAIRRIGTDVQDSSTVSIYPSYSSITGSGASYGSCAILQTGSSTSVAYYRYASNPADVNSGGLYYCSNASLSPSPARDTLLVSGVQDLEFRGDVGNTIRAGFKIGIYGYPTFLTGSKEADLVRFTTSNLPRNP